MKVAAVAQAIKYSLRSYVAVMHCLLCIAEFLLTLYAKQKQPSNPVRPGAQPQTEKQTKKQNAEKANTKKTKNRVAIRVEMRSAAAIWACGLLAQYLQIPVVLPCLSGYRSLFMTAECFHATPRFTVLMMPM